MSNQPTTLKDRRDLRLPGLEIAPRRTAVRWPNDARLAVALTVDCYGSEAVDVHHMISSTLDYGPNRGIWNLVECLDAFGIKGTFNIAGATAEGHPHLASAIDQAGHEVGVLGYRYEPHWELGAEEEQSIIRRAVAAVADATGRQPQGWRTPQSRPSVSTFPMLVEAGLFWDSSLRNDELPYGLQLGAAALVEIPAGGSNDDSNYVGFPYPNTPAGSLLSVWLDELEVIYGESENHAGMLVFSLTPGFMGRRVGLSLVRELLTRIKALDGVWFARCADLASWWRENDYWRKG